MMNEKKTQLVNKCWFCNMRQRYVDTEKYDIMRYLTIPGRLKSRGIVIGRRLGCSASA